MTKHDPHNSLIKTDLTTKHLDDKALSMSICLWNLVHNSRPCFYCTCIVCTYHSPCLTVFVLKDKSRTCLIKSPFVLPSGIFHWCTYPFYQNLILAMVFSLVNYPAVDDSFKLWKDNGSL